jgi:glycosyltransferase involved in cell wall biosynthesis
VILNTDQLTREFCHHYGPDFVPRFNLLTNGYDPEDLEGIEIGKRNQTSKKLVITHTGTFYKQRDPSCFIQALGELAARGLITKESMEVNLVGRFTMSGTSPERLIAQYPLEGILNIIPPVSHRESLMFLARSDVLLLIQPATNLQVPAKLFEYMLFRKPILGLTSGGAVDEIIKGGRLGIVVRADDILEIQRAILRFYERPFPGFDPDETFLNKFHIHRLAERLDQILKVAIGRPCEGILKGDRNILWR